MATAGRLEGRVALISGGARGQGEAEARLFASEGAKVMLADVLDEAGRKVASEIGDAAAYVHLDVTKEDEWAAAVAWLKKKLPVIWYFPNFLFELPDSFNIRESLEDAEEESNSSKRLWNLARDV